jgi:uncharacterized membrane protein YphA (DoxX/SURF4 family)
MTGSRVDCPSPEAANDAGPPAQSVQPSHTARWLTFACRWTLAVIFLMAGTTKVIDLRSFADQILVHSRLPLVLGWPVVVFLPWLELTCGFCLAVDYARRESAAILAVLLLLLLGYSVFRIGESDCQCFFFPRVVEQWPSWWTPLRNWALLLCCLQVARR